MNSMEQSVLRMGPHHPGFPGPLHLELSIDGEMIREGRPYIGYFHRSFEKHAENLEFCEIIPFVDRLDHYAPMNNSLGYVLAVERLAGISPPERIQYIRVLLAELNRIASHLAFLGNFSLAVNTFSPFVYAQRDREKVIEIFEEITGARVYYNFNRIGGIASDLTSDALKKINNVCHFISMKLDGYKSLLTSNRMVIERTEHIGILSADIAVNYSVSGPNLRASGVEWDLRKHDPYLIYDRLQFETPVGKGSKGVGGDCWDRIMVRIEEIEQSVKIIEQAIEGMPEGAIHQAEEEFICPPEGEIYIRTETPRGESGFYLISDGTMQPVRIKARTPSFSNLHVIEELLRGAHIDDVIPILGSLDISISEVDR